LIDLCVQRGNFALEIDDEVYIQVICIFQYKTWEFAKKIISSGACISQTTMEKNEWHDGWRVKSGLIHFSPVFICLQCVARLIFSSLPIKYFRREIRIFFFFLLSPWHFFISSAVYQALKNSTLVTIRRFKSWRKRFQSIWVNFRNRKKIQLFAKISKKTCFRFSKRPDLIQKCFSPPYRSSVNRDEKLSLRFCNMKQQYFWISLDFVRHMPTTIWISILISCEFSIPRDSKLKLERKKRIEILFLLKITLFFQILFIFKIQIFDFSKRNSNPQKNQTFAAKRNLKIWLDRSKRI